MVKKDGAQPRRSPAPVWSRSRRAILAGAATVGLALVVGAPAASANAPRCAHANTPIASASRPQLQATVVCLINRQRTERRLPRLHANPRLNRSAQGWTNEMVRQGSFTHGADFAARISAVGFVWSQAGENIATGFSTPSQVVSAWMASTGHCQNILSPAFADVGTGITDRPIAGFGSAGATWAQDFGLPRGQAAPSADTAPAAGCPYA